LQKWQKLKKSRFECQWIENLTTSSTRYDIPHSDDLLHCGSQKTHFLVDKIELRF